MYSQFPHLFQTLSPICLRLNRWVYNAKPVPAFAPKSAAARAYAALWSEIREKIALKMTASHAPGVTQPTTEFQPKCPNCGGALPAPVDQTAAYEIIASIPRPLPAPRPAPPNYIRRNLLTSGGAITGLVFLILGAVFSIVGGVLTVLIITAFVGVPFFLLGLLFVL